MKYNFFVIPAVIIFTAYLGICYTNKGLKDWYKHLKKPANTPPGKLIGEIWTFIYITTGFAILWFWNVPRFGVFQYVVGAIMLGNAYLNATWTKTFFVEHNLKKSIKQINLLNATTIVAAIIMVFSSTFAALLMLPYIIWVSLATKLNKQIERLNKS